MPRGFPLKPNYGVMALFCCRWPRFSKKGSGHGSMLQPAKPDRSPQQTTFANGVPKGYGVPFVTSLRPRATPLRPRCGHDGTDRRRGQKALAP
jgi:hypothetical protein